ncbi:MAG: sensor domain-containing diguanylate cyclase [Campylobacterota bacterium]|nr:sensor domain-containing diguanylate cyclase [Campylobacterota bacterium]
MQNITKLVCAKNKISYVVFNRVFKILDFNNTIENIADDATHLKVGSDVRELMYELVGMEEELIALQEGNSQEGIIHFPMIHKEDEYYDLDIETFVSDEKEKLFIAYFIQKPKESLSHVSMIKEINKKALAFESKDKKSTEFHFDLINQHLLSFNVDLDGIITLANSAFSYFFDLGESEIVGKHFSHFFKARDLNLNANATIIFNAINLKEEIISFHANIIPVTKDGTIYENIVLCQDITYLKQIEQELEYAAGHDSLTGLPNRSKLLKKMDESMQLCKQNATTFTICFIDLDRFKPVNDNYGHHAGDMLLKHIAKVLSDFVRKGDMVARIGGDEFIILFDSLSDDKYIETMKTRLQELPPKHPLIYSQDDTIEFGFSLGLASYPQDATEAQELLKLADKAMYMSKRKS